MDLNRIKILQENNRENHWDFRLDKDLLHRTQSTTYKK